MRSSNLLPNVAWVLAAGLVAMAGFLAWQFPWTGRSVVAEKAANTQVAVETLPEQSAPADVVIPQYAPQNLLHSITRKAELHTIIPNRPQAEVRSYTVSTGDSVFEIASKFSIKPESLLWANYDILNDNPDTISIGMDLKIPPVDGVYYQWQEGDTIESVSGRFEAEAGELLSWPGNDFDLTNPEVTPGTWVMVPGGHREFRQWVIPVIPRGAAGVSKSVYGPGACEGSYEGAYGSGAFIWPAGNHYLSGNDYWSGHLGIDIAAGEGAPIYAADSGVVVFSGWATGGYGYMVMIDHGNGYQSVYAHLSGVAAGCGRSVGQGQTIGYSGSTGNSTGAHLHFEVRFNGGFVSPWYVLPAP